MTSRRVRIAERFHGPPESGNGGYVCGLVAKSLGGSGCAVTLRLPPPLERDLELRADDAGAQLFDGDVLVALAVPERLELEIPPPPSLTEARAAEERYAGFHHHNFPSCFVCGPQRAAGDGLRIFPGAAAGGRVAAEWVSGTDLAAEAGTVGTEFLWAALDCPGYFAVEQAAGLAVLGRMTAVIDVAPEAGEALVVSGWAIASEGRKHHVGTALHDERGRLIASARSTWISIVR